MVNPGLTQPHIIPSCFQAGAQAAVSQATALGAWLPSIAERAAILPGVRAGQQHAAFPVDGDRLAAAQGLGRAQHRYGRARTGQGRSPPARRPRPRARPLRDARVGNRAPPGLSMPKSTMLVRAWTWPIGLIFAPITPNGHHRAAVAGDHGRDDRMHGALPGADAVRVGAGRARSRRPGSAAGCRSARSCARCRSRNRSS